MCFFFFWGGGKCFQTKNMLRLGDFCPVEYGPHLQQKPILEGASFLEPTSTPWLSPNAPIRWKEILNFQGRDGRGDVFSWTFVTRPPGSRKGNFCPNFIPTSYQSFGSSLDRYLDVSSYAFLVDCFNSNIHLIENIAYTLTYIVIVE